MKYVGFFSLFLTVVAFVAAIWIDEYRWEAVFTGFLLLLVTLGFLGVDSAKQKDPQRVTR